VSFVSNSVFLTATWIAAICGGIGVGAAFVSAIVGYRLTEEALTESNLKIAEATARQKEAELQLEKLRTQARPRHLTIDGDAFIGALAGKPSAPVEIMFPKDDGEAFLLAIGLRDLLRKAKWETAEPIPVPPNDIPRLANQPSLMTAGGQPIGVTIAARADTQEEMKLLGDGLKFGDDPEPNIPIRALNIALLKVLGSVSGHIGGPEVFKAPPPGTIRIVVGPKA